MTQSFVSRGSFDVKPSYMTGDYIGVFFPQPLEFHINWRYFTEESPHWYTCHSFGLPLLLAPFLAAAPYLHEIPLFALQAGMVLWESLAAVVVYYYCLELTGSRVAALSAAAALVGSLSYLALVGHLIPDVLIGILLAVGLLILISLRRQPRSLSRLALLSVVAGFAPYLHVKTGLMAATLLALALFHWWRSDRRVVALLCLILPAAILLSIYATKIHSWYRTWVVTAPFSHGLFHYPPGPSIVASLLDTSRGVLPNNPAFVLIIAGLPIWWKRDRRSLLMVLAVVLPSVLLQSTFEDWAGGFSPAGGRYMMPLMISTLPALAFLFAHLKWLGRTLLSLILLVHVVIGAIHADQDYRWSYAGDDNPLFSYFHEAYGLPRRLGTAIYDENLHMVGPDAAIYMVILSSCLLAAFCIGITLAARATTQIAHEASGRARSLISTAAGPRMRLLLPPWTHNWRIEAAPAEDKFYEVARARGGPDEAARNGAEKA